MATPTHTYAHTTSVRKSDSECTASAIIAAEPPTMWLIYPYLWEIGDEKNGGNDTIYINKVKLWNRILTAAWHRCASG